MMVDARFRIFALLKMSLIHGKEITGVCILLMLIGLTSCGNLRLQTQPQTDEGKWQQYGGNKERTNVSHTLVTPPLSLLWMYDASAGFSEYSVTVSDSIAYIGNLQGEVHAIHVKTGEGVGSYDFGSPVFGAPIVDDGMLYVAIANTEESLCAYDLTKGKIVWKALLGGIETSPLLVGERLVVTTLDGDVFCVDKHSGKIIWKFLTPLFERSAFLHSSPASDGNNVVFGCDDGFVFCVNGEDGKLLWRAETKKSVFATPSIRNGIVYVGSQDEWMYAFNLSDGKPVWKQSLGARIYASQCVDSAFVYVGTSGGEVVCLNNRTGAIVWRYKAQSAISSAPFLAGATLYFGDLNRTLYALDATTGTLLWNTSTEGRIKSMPVAWRGYVIVPLDNRMVLGFKSEGGK